MGHAGRRASLHDKSPEIWPAYEVRCGFPLDNGVQSGQSRQSLPAGLTFMPSENGGLSDVWL